MSDTLKFRRGDKVRTMRENVNGTIVGYVEILGSDRMWVMDIPMTAEKSTYAGECHTVTVDESELVFVSSGEEKYSADFPTDFKFDLGTVVKHAYLTDTEGMIMSRRCHANGCFYYRIALPVLDEGKKLKEGNFSEVVLIGNNKPLPFMKNVNTGVTTTATPDTTATATATAGKVAPKGKRGGPREVVSKHVIDL